MTRLALGIARERNRDLLTGLFPDYEVVSLEDSVPERTDMCLVDERTLTRAEEALAAWRTAQSPTFAPVLLLVETQSGNPWERYVDELFGVIDGIQQIPAPRSAITARVENLLETRHYSRELSIENQLTQRVFDTSPLAKVVLDTDCTIVRANERAGTLLGREQAALEGLSFDDEWTFVTEDGAQLTQEETPFARVLETDGPVYDSTHGIRRGDGDVVWVSVNMAPLRDENGAVEYVVGALDDITDSRAQKAELERQVDLFQKAQDIAGVGAWEYDLRNDDVWVSREVARIYGLGPDAEASLEKGLEYFHPEDRPALASAFEAAIVEGESYDLELRLVDEAGDLRWVRTRGQPQYEDGEIVRVRGTIQEITERKEQEMELTKMSRAVDRAPIGVSITDPSLDDNPLVYVNDGFVDLTGYSRSESTGRNCRFLQGENTDPETVDTIRESIDAGEPVSVVVRNYRADGTEFWNSLEIAPVRDDAGEILNYIGFQQDVTERVERQRQLQTLDRYLRHNLRNELNVVQGMAELIGRDGEGQLTEYAARIVEHSCSLIETMDKERELTQLLADEPVVEDIDVMTVLTPVVTALETEFPEAALSLSGPDTARASATGHLEMAFDELARNAIQHNDSATPRVDITVRTDGDHVTVSVADNGPGIPQMELDVLTDPDEETSVYHAQGLGLWLVYLITRRCGATIDFDESAHGGTVATLTLQR